MRKHSKSRPPGSSYICLTMVEYSTSVFRDLRSVQIALRFFFFFFFLFATLLSRAHKQPRRQQTLPNDGSRVADVSHDTHIHQLGNSSAVAEVFARGHGKRPFVATEIWTPLSNDTETQGERWQGADTANAMASAREQRP